uniref:Uncharacterized protein n=1 Tax=Meloidogyne enterolobii TaxID=390850 RepID=A0A6V7TIJ8_MELEN|nr:unnamed protein product [Meloidogyne enterolobii]
MDSDTPSPQNCQNFCNFSIIFNNNFKINLNINLHIFNNLILCIKINFINWCPRRK